MKHLIYLLLIAATCFIGCKGNMYERVESKNVIPYSTGVTVMVVNECQYVCYQGHNGGDFAMVHAGNCNNPFHNQKIKTNE